MALLIEFLLRLSFGLAAAMASVSPRKVTSGYFRNHLYVILGLSSLATLLSRVAFKQAFGWALAVAILSYAGSVVWLYEKRALGLATLIAISALALAGALVMANASQSVPIAAANATQVDHFAAYLRYLQTVSSGLLLGTTMAAMLLGHWYLNAPGMEIAPLRKLLFAMAAATVFQAIVCGVGLGLEASTQALSTQDWLFVLLRWSFGLGGVIVLIWLAWQTLAIPNTQSATGILYVAVMGVFVGETMSLLLSAESLYPV